MKIGDLVRFKGDEDPWDRLYSVRIGDLILVLKVCLSEEIIVYKGLHQKTGRKLMFVPRHLEKVS
jgi:hypothetical protein